MNTKNKMIICTVGISISNGCPSQRDLLSKPTNWNDVIKKFVDEINERVNKKGLQVNNSPDLKKVGLKNFISTALKYLDDKSISYQYDVIINPTGGFKGVLPFLTILGMMYGKKTVYIFEFADELIYLPPLPFTFDLSIFDRVKPALEYIEDKATVPKQEYLSKIKWIFRKI